MAIDLWKDTMILPYKLLFKGALHMATPIVATEEGTSPTITQFTNERLACQDDIDFWASWIPYFLQRGCRMYATWLTVEEGLVAVTDPVLEYGLRILRGLRKLQVGFRDEWTGTEEYYRRHLECFSGLVDGQPSVRCYLRSFNDQPLLGEMHAQFLCFWEGDDTGMLDLPDFYLSCEAAWRTLEKTVLSIGAFWGLESEVECQPETEVWPCPYLEVAVEGRPMTKAYTVLSRERLKATLHMRYLESLKEIFPNRDEWGEAARLLCLKPQSGCCPAATTRGYFVDRCLEEDVKKALELKRKMDSGPMGFFQRMRFYFGLYLMMGNGDSYREFYA